jgi:hypothetical protein
MAHGVRRAGPCGRPGDRHSERCSAHCRTLRPGWRRQLRGSHRRQLRNSRRRRLRNSPPAPPSTASPPARCPRRCERPRSVGALARHRGSARLRCARPSRARDRCAERPHPRRATIDAGSLADAPRALPRERPPAGFPPARRGVSSALQREGAAVGGLHAERIGGGGLETFPHILRQVASHVASARLSRIPRSPALRQPRRAPHRIPARRLRRNSAVAAGPRCAAGSRHRCRSRQRRQARADSEAGRRSGARTASRRAAAGGAPARAERVWKSCRLRRSNRSRSSPISTKPPARAQRTPDRRKVPASQTALSGEHARTRRASVIPRARPSRAARCGALSPRPSGRASP